MNTPYLDPLIPLDETSEDVLRRLSVNIGTLTGLMNDAERVGHYYLAAMFNRARDAKVGQAEEIIARMTARSIKAADDRRFLLVRGVGSTGTVPPLIRRGPLWSPSRPALTL